jgi:CubicO group peptidase (beta-lactamase class C family)
MPISRPIALFAALCCVSVFAAHQAAAQLLEPFPSPERLAASLDSVVRDEMEKSHIPGAAVVVVKDGRVYWTRGYGLADVASRRPVNPERTIFRVGSISKVFTSTALVQLADRGRLRLDEDVNRYLPDWKVAAPYGRPVTAANLLTHTAGFDEINPGRKAPTAAEVLPLGTFLRERLVPRFAPGGRSSYSTYGMALAGYLVEAVSGLHLREYLRRELFSPLGMERSSLGAVPDSLRGDVATGYVYAAGGYHAAPWEHFHTYPASDVNATAADMAKFMIAHLEGGRHGAARVLSDSATRLMQAVHVRNHPRLAGFGYGFFEQRLQGQRAVRHSGSMEGYNATMWLWPGARMGVFVAYNRETPSLEQRVVRRFAARTLARLDTLDTEGTPWLRPRVRDDLRRFAGRYREDTWCHSCRGELGYVPAAFDVRVLNDSTLSFWGGEWAQVEPLLFRVMNGQLEHGEMYVAFQADSAGRIVRMLNGPRVNERVDAPTAGGAPAPRVRVPLRDLEACVGRYLLPNGATVTVTLTGGELFGEMAGVGRAALVPVSRTTFAARELDAELTFVAERRRPATHFLLRRVGQPEVRAVRVEP